MISKPIVFNEKFQTTRYANGQLAVFIHGYHGEPIAELSLCANSVQLAHNEFILKDYSENEDIANELIELGLIKFSERFVLIGSHLCPVCYTNFEM